MVPFVCVVVELFTRVKVKPVAETAETKLGSCSKERNPALLCHAARFVRCVVAHSVEICVFATRAS